MAENAKPTTVTEEWSYLVDFLLALKKAQIGEFLRASGLAVHGTKEMIRSRVLTALIEGRLVVENVVAFLDEVVPWGKQHVFLFRGPTYDIQWWQDAAFLRTRLATIGWGEFLNKRTVLVLPPELRLSTVSHAPGVLRVLAVQRRDYLERTPDLDEVKRRTAVGAVEYHAYLRHVTRTLVVFEWNLLSNTAQLQITQLPSGDDYESVFEEFTKLISPLLDIAHFHVVDLQGCIKRLHESEEMGLPEARSHAIDFRTLEGRRLSGASASRRSPLVGDKDIDAALRSVRQKGVGHLGNFYWLPKVAGGAPGNVLDNEVHTVIVGAKHRVNFTIPYTEQVIRYVLSRIRALSI